MDGSPRPALLIFWELVRRGWKSPIRPAYRLGACYAWMEVADPPCLSSGSSLRVDGSRRSALLIFWELVTRGWKSPIRPAYILGARYAWMEVSDPPCLYSGSSLGVDGSLRSAMLIFCELVTRGWKSPIRPAYILGARYAGMGVSDILSEPSSQLKQVRIGPTPPDRHATNRRMAPDWTPAFA